MGINFRSKKGFYSMKKTATPHHLVNNYTIWMIVKDFHWNIPSGFFLTRNWKELTLELLAVAKT